MKNRDKDLLGVIERPVERFEKLFKVSVIVDLALLDECFIKEDETVTKAFPPVTDVNEFKQAGTICFWVRKLKPFRLERTEENTVHPIHLYVNELLAFLIAYQLIFGVYSLKGEGTRGFHKPHISKRYLSDFVKTMRYNSYSPHSLVQIFESLCI